MNHAWRFLLVLLVVCAVGLIVHPRVARADCCRFVGTEPPVTWGGGFVVLPYCTSGDCPCVCAQDLPAGEIVVYDYLCIRQIFCGGPNDTACGDPIITAVYNGSPPPPPECRKFVNGNWVDCDPYTEETCQVLACPQPRVTCEGGTCVFYQSCPCCGSGSSPLLGTSAGSAACGPATLAIEITHAALRPARALFY